MIIPVIIILYACLPLFVIIDKICSIIFILFRYREHVYKHAHWSIFLSRWICFLRAHLYFVLSAKYTPLSLFSFDKEKAFITHTDIHNGLYF